MSKAELLQTISPLDCGRASLSSQSTQRKVMQAIKSAEGYNPSARPTEDPNLSGTWEMVYTTSSSILGANRPPPLRPTTLLQIIAPGGSRITNVEEVYPLGEGRLKPKIVSKVDVAASIEGASRVNVQFQQFNLLNGLIKRDVSDNERFGGWLEVTYLDQDMRISRGDEGNVFVLLRRDDTEYMT